MSSDSRAAELPRYPDSPVPEGPCIGFGFGLTPLSFPGQCRAEAFRFKIARSQHGRGPWAAVHAPRRSDSKSPAHGACEAVAGPPIREQRLGPLLGAIIASLHS